MDELQDNLLKAMTMVAQRCIEKAQVDKTYVCRVVRCVNKKNGEHIVKHMDSNIPAMASPNTEIAAGSEVYVLFTSEGRRVILSVANGSYSGSVGGIGGGSSDGNEWIDF